jgi:pimeloyl-ACP methyl ester carboxylesterase
MLAQADDRMIAALDRITVPTLVLVGADDTHFLAAADYMARKIPGALRVTVPGAGHASNLHQPGLFNRAVADFLARLPAAI